jgi:hypothetical protein
MKRLFYNLSMYFRFKNGQKWVLYSRDFHILGGFDFNYKKNINFI